MPDMEKVIKELVCLPTTVYGGFYQLRITHDLRDKVVKLLKEQEARIRELEEELRALEYGDQDTLKSAMMPAT